MEITKRVWPAQELDMDPVETSWWTNLTHWKHKDAVPTLGITLSFPKGPKPALQLFLMGWDIQIGWFVE